MRATYDDTKRHILDSGQRIIAAKGFAAVGLAEILQAASIPKGSFYHYFESKEDYGRAMLEQYLLAYGAELDALLRVEAGGTAYQRLMRYWTQWSASQAGDCGDDKCLVVKLGAEVADLSDSMRETLRRGTDGLIRRLRDCIAQGQAEGSIHSRQDPEALGQQLYQMWLGASLLSKLRRDGSALQLSLQLTEQLLRPPA